MADVWWSQGGSRYHSHPDCDAFKAGQQKALEQGLGIYEIRPGPLVEAIRRGLTRCLECELEDLEVGPKHEALSATHSARTAQLSSDWEAWRNTHGATSQTRYERLFVEQVLTQTEGLQPATVLPQRAVTAPDGTVYYVDFAIEEPGVRIAIEIDGINKTGGGPATPEQQEASNRRNAVIQLEGWRLLRFGNNEVSRHPHACRQRLETLLHDLRATQRRHDKAQRAIADLQTATVTLKRAAERQAVAASPASAPNERRGVKAASAVLAVVVVATAVALLASLATKGDPHTHEGGDAAATLRTEGVTPIDGQCPPDAPIKGNINDEGEHIYHVEHGDFYGRTSPEVCFRTNEEASAAGFRASQR